VRRHPLLHRLSLACAALAADAELDTEIRLLHPRASSPASSAADAAAAPPPSAVVLSPARPQANPLICIANYVFDSLSQEAWRVVGGQLQEGRVSLYSDRPEALPLPPGADPVDAIRRLKCVWDWGSPTREADLDGGPAAAAAAAAGGSSAAGGAALAAAGGGAAPSPWQHADPVLALVLQAYAARLGTGSVLLPVGGLAAVDRLSSLAAGGRCFALVGDKAYAQEEELAGLRDPHVALHGGFSFMANLSAARLATLAGGGFSLHSPYLEGFKVAAFLRGGLQHLPRRQQKQQQQLPPSSPAELLAAADATLPPGALSSLPDLLLAWADAMDTFGPDNFVALQRCARDESRGDAASLRLALATLRLSAWDADVFYKFRANIIDRSPSASEKLAADMALDVAAVTERYFPMHATKDVSFELGRVCMGLRRYHDALALFTASQRQCGEHHVSWYNMGISQWYLGSLDASRECFVASLRMRPDYADASNWLTKVEAKLQGDAFSAASTGGPATNEGAPT
jgi:tetratricopeptide (TPR) repeat protein